MSKPKKPESTRVLLFSGHMIDAPERASPRFPPGLEPQVKQAIDVTLDGLRASATDVAISSGACGSDILFDEAVIERGVPLRLYLPFDEGEFRKRSVNFANDHWPERYGAVAARARRFIARDQLGPPVDGADPFERTNLWMLDEAHRIGGAHIAFICVWNGEGADGPGGTKHMMDAVRSAGGGVHWIDIRTLQP